MKKVMMTIVLMAISSVSMASVHTHIDKMRSMDDASKVVEVKSVDRAYETVKAFHNRADAEELEITMNSSDKSSDDLTKPKKFRA